jgi:ribosomal protein L25 (general stress protein Ctc)
MEIIALQGQPKTGSGKEEVKKIRRNGQVPAVIYKSGGGDALSFSLNAPEVRSLVFTSKFKLTEITIDGRTPYCMSTFWNWCRASSSKPKFRSVLRAKHRA